MRGADPAARAAIVREAELRAVALVTANGWVDVYEGRPNRFLELAHLPPAPFDAVLIAHELTHVVHQRRRGGRVAGNHRGPAVRRRPGDRGVP